MYVCMYVYIVIVVCGRIKSKGQNGAGVSLKEYYIFFFFFRLASVTYVRVIVILKA